MGQKLTQSKNTVVPEADTFLEKYLPQLQFEKLLSNGIFLKTVLCTNESDGEPIVCKIYFKRELNEQEMKMFSKHVESMKEIRELYNIKTSPNIAPIIIVNDNIQNAGIIIRQYYSYNLKERTACMPYLTPIEKKWISFQLIYALMQLHNKGYCHGDIKMENVMLSSTSSVFLADIAPYKPAYIQQDDVGSFTYYFATNSSVKNCYLAPERLVTRSVIFIK
jgi:phosphoinositide-3-kinase regulatory subunit 4